MAHYQNIEVKKDKHTFTITLNRPEKRNAINEQTMDELLQAIQSIQEENDVKMAVIRATGPDFSAGADLDWMRNTQQMSQQEIEEQSMKLQKVFALWFDLPIFTVARVHGNVVGGALGIMAASNLVIAHSNTKFRFSEVTLGLMPATIAPFVLQRTQHSYLRNAMLTAMPFDSNTALNINLIDAIADENEENDLFNIYNDLLNKTETSAVGETKLLVNDLIFNRIKEPIDNYTVRMLAQVRKSETASQRIEAFFKNRI